MKQSSPMPTVTYDGNTYKLKSRKIAVPDLQSMERFSALIWLINNTTSRGYSKPSNPLAGMGGAITLR